MSSIVKHNAGHLAPPNKKFGFDVDLLRSTICKDLNAEEFNMFIHICAHSGLDPLAKQIYAIKRKDRVCIQTSIDGLRLIANRTGRYVPGRESTFTYDNNGQLVSATSYIKVLAKDNTWHEVGATAYFEEYCQFYQGKPSGQWATMKRVMLAKCAEAAALRRAFPAETSKIYANEEMHQAEPVEVVDVASLKISQEEAIWLLEQFKDNRALLDMVYEKYRIADLNQLTNKQFKIILERLEQIKNENSSSGTTESRVA